MKYRADIDGLRAVAVLLVVVFHFDLLSAGDAGFIGVDVFFVISGFLITRILAADVRAGDLSFRRFFYRRVRRLYPAMLATLALFAGVGALWVLPPLYEELMFETALSLVYGINFYFWQNVNYFGLIAGKLPLLHFWSLAVEEQFYILYPVAWLALARLAPRLWLPALVAGMLASFALSVVATPWKPEAAFYLLPTRAWEMLAGGVLALATERRAPGAAAQAMLGAAGLALIGVALAIHSPVTQAPGWYAALPVAGAAALIAGGISGRAPVARLLASGPFVFVGRISYPLYLVHWPILILTNLHLPQPTIGVRLAATGLSVLLAWAIYAGVERPIRSGRVLADPRRFLAAAVGGSATLAAVAVAVVLSGGAPGRFPAEVNAVLAYKDDLPVAWDRCNAQAGPCLIGEGEAPPDLLVFGDSHSRALAPAFDQALTLVGRRGLLSFQPLCPPVLEVQDPGCTRFVEKAMARAEADPAIRQVALVSIWRYARPGSGLRVDGEWRGPETANAAFLANLRRTVERLRAAGKEVILVEPLFAARGLVPETLAANLAFGRELPVDRPMSEHLAEFGWILDAFAGLEGEGVVRVAPKAPFCDATLCRAVHNGRPVFTDSNHLATSQAGAVARELAETALAPR